MRVKKQSVLWPTQTKRAFTGSVFNPAGSCCWRIMTLLRSSRPLSIRRPWQSEKRSVGAALHLWRLRAAKRTGGGEGRGRSSHDSPVLGSGSFHKSHKSRGPVNDFHIEEQRSKYTPTVQFPESQHKTTSRLNSSFTHRLLRHRAGILLAQPTSVLTFAHWWLG